MTINRRIWLYFIVTAFTIICGLLSRTETIPLPAFVSTYAGDTLWALMVFLGLCMIAKHRKTWELALTALVFSFAIELSQFYQAPWINDLRHTTLGGLILGFGFKWSDLLCYTLGVLSGALIDGLLQHTGKNKAMSSDTAD